jgi:hypothetical protein
MNFLKKGPELKLSELKVPDFLYDLFYDLKERHLLPVVALLLVAMVAAPIYFKGSSKSEPEADATLPTTATASSVAAGGETLVVAQSEPGLRDYRRRLKEYRALDPFRATGGGKTTASEVTNSSTGSPEAATPEASLPEAPPEATVVGGETSAPPEISTAPPSTPESSGGPVEAPPASTGDTGGPTKTRYASDSIDVRIVTVPAGSTEQAKTKAKKPKPKAQVRRNLPELTMLPARGTPAATYIGLTNDGKKALFVISSDVVSLFGEGNCVIGSQSCQLLALEPGLPETFVYGPQEHTYRIELLKIDKTLSAKPRRASLGATKGKQHPQAGSEAEGGEAANGAGTEAGPGGEAPSERG